MAIKTPLVDKKYESKLKNLAIIMSMKPSHSKLI